MKIKMTKNENAITAKIIDDNNVEKDFSNFAMIDYLYKNNKDINFEFDDSFSKDEKEKINKLFDTIKEKIKKDKNENKVTK